MIRISIVTISYNQSAYLPMALASVSRQMQQGDQHIVVDPGSQDGSRQIIAAYAGREGRCEPIFEGDRGPADGLNKGFGAAIGEVLAYVNADDWLLPGALNFVRSYFAANTKCDVLMGSIKLADQTGCLALRGRVPDPPAPARFSADAFQYYQQGTFFRRSAFLCTKGFNVQNRTCWDRELIVDLAIAGAKFHVTSRPLGAFRIHGHSITGGGGNSVAYHRDTSRIRLKAVGVWGDASPFRRRWLRWESRFNPWRWMKQLRPLPVR